MNTIRSFYNRILTRFRDSIEEFDDNLFDILIVAAVVGYAGISIWISWKSIERTWDWIMNNDIVSTIFLCLFGLIVFSISIVYISIFTKLPKLTIATRSIFIVGLICLLALSAYSVLMASFSAFPHYLAGCFILFFLCGYAIYLLFTHFSFSIYIEERYTLYLRSFRSDGNYKEIEDEINKLENNFINILTIANPKTLLRKNIGHTLYMPSINWKKFIEFYILKARSVIVVLDNSDGVMWEIFQHPDQFHKYIFIAPNRQILQDVADKLTDNHDIWNLLTDLAQTNEGEILVFTIVDDMCNTYDLQDLNKLVKKARIRKKRENKALGASEISLAEVVKIDRIRNFKESTFMIMDDIWKFMIYVYELICDFISYDKWFNICFYILFAIFAFALGIALFIVGVILVMEEADITCIMSLIFSLIHIYISIIAFLKAKDLI